MCLFTQRRFFATILLLGLGSMTGTAHAQDPPPIFEEMLLNEVGALRFGAAAWGDADGDGDYELFVHSNLGTFDNPVPFTQFYLNRGDTFNQIPDENTPDPDDVITVHITAYEHGLSTTSPVILDVWRGAIAWGDYDNDGDLDVASTGIAADGTLRTTIYENIGSPDRFAARFSFVGISDGTIAWADYDNDGDLDLLLSGSISEAQGLTVLYENRVREGGGFVEREAGLPDLRYSSIAWGDYDNDGDLDLLLAGVAEPQLFTTALYRNDGNGVFIEVNAGLQGLLYASVAWGDYDADGDLDILLSGAKLTPFVLEGEVKVYQNMGGVFADNVAVEGRFGERGIGYFHGSVGWGDFDNDGRLDFLATGLQGANATQTGQVFRNAGGHRFTAPPFGVQSGQFTGGSFGATFWGDYDGDYDLDLFTSGHQPDGSAQRQSLRNPQRYYGANTPPTAPGALQSDVQGSTVSLNWSPGNDAQTPQAGLLYNLRVGTTPGGTEIMSPMAHPATGRRLLTGPGNAGPQPAWVLRNLPSGTYYWSVQALDTSFSGSPFAAEALFVIP